MGIAIIVAPKPQLNPHWVTRNSIGRCRRSQKSHRKRLCFWPTMSTSPIILQSFDSCCEVSKQGYMGRTRSVDEFEKLNRVGEGTYGVVCT